MRVIVRVAEDDNEWGRVGLPAWAENELLLCGGLREWGRPVLEDRHGNRCVVLSERNSSAVPPRSLRWGRGTVARLGALSWVIARKHPFAGLPRGERLSLLRRGRLILLRVGSSWFAGPLLWG